MGPEDKRQRLWPRLALAAVVAAAAGLALVWVFLVPIYQAPDEPQHLDYALAINTHRGLFRVHGKKYYDFPGVVHPYSVYLIERAHTNAIAFHPENKVPPGYGTLDFYRALDRNAPRWDSIPVKSPNPLITVYPFGYYAVLAVWIEGLRKIRESPVFIFFGARLFNVLLLVCTLLLIHGTARLLRFRPWPAVLLTACVGLFPMTTFVSSYVQPDNLGFTLASLAFYLALRVRQNPRSLAAVGLLGLTLGMLLVTKLHFFVCIGVPVFALVAVETFQRPGVPWRMLGSLTLLGLPCAAAGAAHLWTVPGTTNFYAPPVESKEFALHTVRWFHRALLNYYGQLTHESFWGIFGWMDTPIQIGRHRTHELVQYATLTAGWVVLALTLFRLEQVASRLYVVWRRGRKWLALRLALSNPLINSYFLFTLLMFYLFVRLENRFAAQGRNWLPFTMPIFLVGLVYAPKALTLRRTRVVFSAALTAGLLLYCVLGSYYSIRTIKKRFYPRPSSPVAVQQPAPPSHGT